MKQVMLWICAPAAGCTAVFSALYLLFGTGFLLTAAITSGTVFYHFAMRLITGFIFDRIMVSHTDCSRSWYHCRSWEMKLYRLLRIRQWKSRMPVYDPAAFDPERHSWDEIAQAMCKAELIHETAILLSFAPVIFIIWFGAPLAFIITSAAAAMFDLLFVMLQRFNRARILKLLQHTHRSEKNAGRPISRQLNITSGQK